MYDTLRRSGAFQMKCIEFSEVEIGLDYNSNRRANYSNDYEDVMLSFSGGESLAKWLFN